MDRSGLIEIRKSLAYKKNDMTVGQFCGCFINVDKDIKGEFSEKLLTKEQPVIHKFLDMYKKVLANDDADVAFNEKDGEDGGFKFLLEKMRATELKNKDINRILFEKVRDCLPDNNYVVTLVYNTYDIPEKTSDKQKIDDASSGIFKYVLCAVCPVKTEKGTLGYLSDKEEIGENPQQLVIDKPTFGFMYPSFNDRAADTGNILCYRTGKLDISEELFSHKAPELVKPEKKAAAAKDVSEIVKEGSISSTESISIGGGYTNGQNPYGSSTSHIPSLDTGSLNNDASYIAERTITDEDEERPNESRCEPTDAQIIGSSGTTMKVDRDAPKRKKRVRITGDESLIEKRVIDGRVYYVIAAMDAEIG